MSSRFPNPALEEEIMTEGNALLEALEASVPGRLAIVEERRESHEIVIEADGESEWLYFPHRGALLSLTRSTDSGATVEVGIVGFEGFATMQQLLAPGGSGVDGVVQIAGMTSRVLQSELRNLMHDSECARELIFAYAAAFLAQVSQHTLCNRLHTIEQRLAKWLLGVRDRIDTDDIELTHDFLSHMLGIRRSGVTVAIGELTLDGLIHHSRNSVTIIDRKGLQGHSCECYAVIAEATRPLLDRLRNATSAPALQAR
jgi:hypothetical protein